MRKAEFAVPTGAMAEFADAMQARDLDNTIGGTNENGEILIEVFYEKDETDEVDELEEVLEKLRDDLEEEDEEDEDEEN